MNNKTKNMSKTISSQTKNINKTINNKSSIINGKNSKCNTKIIQILIIANILS